MPDDHVRTDRRVTGRPGRTGLVLDCGGVALPRVLWSGTLRTDDPTTYVAAASADGVALLPEHSTGWAGRPGISGFRVDADRDSADAGALTGRDWSTQFTVVTVHATEDGARIEASDVASGLGLVTEVEALAGGAVRARHTVTNLGPQPYVVESLDVVFPLPARADEALDLTGRHNSERWPQRHRVTDGLYLREGRSGRTNFDSATVLMAGTTGFSFTRGEIWGVHVAWSGNHVYRLERSADGLTTIGGGELLLPGEVCLAQHESYSTPWVFLATATDGMDGVAAQFHGYLRSLPAHPSTPRPVTLNVWEAVYFDHGIDRLRELADLAASIGVERYVLDDGWFRHRRSDDAGLGDWYVDEDVWPDGLAPIVDHVTGLGMQFGLWFEPEMVNPDSDLFRAHPDWILNIPGRTPGLQRNQLVLDLSRPEVTDYLLERIDAVLATYDIGYVKWDHNRTLVDAGGASAAGAPVVHANVLAYYRLLDELRRRHPDVEWESCASGGGRIDLAVLERTERVWVSDMTDARSRQRIQRWTGQLVAPEYLGAHISSDESHQTGRRIPLSFRAATAFFGHFGIEWDLTAADGSERAHIAEWIELFKTHRGLLHSGRVVRLDDLPDGLLAHGVVATDQASALVAVVAVDEAQHTVAVDLRVPGLDPERSYVVRRIDPRRDSPVVHGTTDAVLPSVPLTGAAIADVGIAMAQAQPRYPQRPETVVLLELLAQ